MKTPYTAAQKRGARKRIQQNLTGCYAGEYRAGLKIGTEEHKTIAAMANETDSQIVGGDIRDGFEWFATKYDAFPYKGFKWN